VSLYHYTVRGSGPFPLDCLRIMRSWPRSDTYAALSQADNAPERCAHLATPWKPGPEARASWMRHGWAIIESYRLN